MSAPKINVLGQERTLGCLPSDLLAAARFPTLDDEFPVMHQRYWPDFGLAEGVVPVLDQGETAASSLFAAVTAMRYAALKDGIVGFDIDSLLPFASRTNGDSILDVLNKLIQYGVPQPSGHNLRVDKAFRTPTFEAVCSAASRGIPVLAGVMVGSNFGQFVYGVSPLPDIAMGGQGMVVVGLRRINGRHTHVRVQHSLGDRFGENGFSWLTAEHFRFLLDAYAVVSVTDKPFVRHETPPRPVQTQDTVPPVMDEKPVVADPPTPPESVTVVSQAAEEPVTDPAGEPPPDENTPQPAEPPPEDPAPPPAPDDGPAASSPVLSPPAVMPGQAAQQKNRNRNNRGGSRK